MKLSQAKQASENETPWQPSKRVKRLLSDHSSSRPALGAERAIHYTEFYKRNEKLLPASLLKAKALADHLARRSIEIHTDEFIVGSHTEHRIGAICHVELAGVSMLEDIFRFEKRKTNPLYVDPQARRKLVLSVIPYWLNKSLIMKAFPLKEKMTYVYEQINARQFVINEAGGIAHFVPNYEMLITRGTSGLREDITQRLNDDSLSSEQQTQLQANLIALEALEAFIGRYRSLAKQKGLIELAAILEHMPYQPPTTLHEALQLIWFYQMIIQIESLDQGISLGRIDQYLYPLYMKEKENGSFDEAHFKNVFSAFCIKLSEVIPLFSERVTELFSGWPSGQALTLGGINQKGEDASNALSLMLLDVADKLKTRQPNWHARISSVSNAEYTHAVFQTIANGGGSPALYNDDVIMPAMAKRFQPDLVWNYATVGCVEPAVQGISFTSSDAAIFNLASILENILLRRNLFGASRLENQPKTDLNAIVSMEALWQMIEAELHYQIRYLKHCLEQIEQANREYHPVPFSSLTVTGCIETATDLTAGGARINASGIQGIGVADLANSLIAINELVFKQKHITLEGFAQACKDNFMGHEQLHSRIANLEKFGNDQDHVDQYAARITALFDDCISQNANTRGGQWMPGFYSMTCHRGMGKRMAALPSGRKAKQALADGLAPCDGSDRMGPTASLNSITKLDHQRFANGINLNVKFDADTLRGKTGTILLEGLIKGYFQQGGMQTQINVLDPKILLDARKNPDNHKNLLVRISGYSAYFVDLTPAMQDEIIERTLQRVS